MSKLMGCHWKGNGCTNADVRRRLKSAACWLLLVDRGSFCWMPLNLYISCTEYGDSDGIVVVDNSSSFACSTLPEISLLNKGECQLK